MQTGYGPGINLLGLDLSESLSRVDQSGGLKFKTGIRVASSKRESNKLSRSSRSPVGREQAGRSSASILYLSVKIRRETAEVRPWNVTG